MSVQIYGENKMSKTINIKGKEISEDTIVEALKKHCGFTEDEPLKAGDIVHNEYGDIRIIVCNNGKELIAYDVYGYRQSSETGRAWKTYKKISVLDTILANNVRDF